jgi:hypothetical protein
MTMIALAIRLALLTSISLAVAIGAASLAEAAEEDVARHSYDLIFATGEGHEAAIEVFAERNNPDIAAILALALRYRRDASRLLADTFSAVTGAQVADWNGAQLWQEAHPEIKPHPSFRQVKLEVLSRVDVDFLRFLGGERSLPENMDIRLEEITWGGVTVDGIPSLDSPAMIPVEDAGYLLDDDLVFGIEINGDVRAYPLRIMGWHEMFNDVIGGVPVALAYCTLCGAGILFETQADGRDEPLIFGSSGLLYRSNKLMFDRQTDSLWNQFTGEPVTGPLRGSGIELKIRPVAITSWADWRARHPDTKVLSLDTGHTRDYGSGVVYAAYFASPDLMFPTIVHNEEQLRRKDYVFGMREAGSAKAWPLSAFEDGAVINDTVGLKPVVLVGDAATRTVRAFYRDGYTFEKTDEPRRLKGPRGQVWTVEEAFLVGPDGTRLARAPGHISYWFAWDGYLGVRSELYEAGN